MIILFAIGMFFAPSPVCIGPFCVRCTVVSPPAYAACNVTYPGGSCGGWCGTGTGQLHCGGSCT